MARRTQVIFDDVYWGGLKEAVDQLVSVTKEIEETTHCTREEANVLRGRLIERAVMVRLWVLTGEQGDFPDPF